MVAGSAGTLQTPMLTGAQFVLGTDCSDPILAWRAAIAIMQDLRQGVGIGRTSKAHGQPGRSLWPEADSLRKLTNSQNDFHRASHPAAPYFPRAAFGLPIVFHFKDYGEPEDSSLEPDLATKGMTRMASPVILKPLLLDSKDKALPLVLLLRTPGLSGERLHVPLHLRQEKGEIDVKSPDWVMNRYKAAEVVPLKGLYDPCERLLRFAAERWGTAVSGLCPDCKAG